MDDVGKLAAAPGFSPTPIQTITKTTLVLYVRNENKNPKNRGFHKYKVNKTFKTFRYVVQIISKT